MGTARSTGVALAAAAALAVSFAGGMVAAGGDGPGRVVAADRDPQPVPVTFPNADLVRPDSCDELLDWYVERGVERVGPYGWDFPVVYYAEAEGLPMATGAEGDARGPAGVRDLNAAAPAPDRSTASATGTNVQEAGVDEPDVVKTDGALLVRVQDGDLTTYDVSGAEPARLESLDLPGLADPELLLVGDRVVVLGTSTREGRPVTHALVVDVADPSAPTVVDDALYDTDLVTARQHGDVVRLVLASGLPDLDFVEPSRWRGEESALEHNRDVVRDSTLADWLPQVTRDGETRPLLGCADVALPDDEAGLGTLTVVGLRPDDPEAVSTSAVATESRLAYFSPDRMYLAAAPFTGFWGPGPWPVTTVGTDDGTTRLYSFRLDGTAAAYTASGRVDGAVADRWSMDEAGGVLRVAVGQTARTGNFNSIVLLAGDGDDLVEVGRVDKLGVNETIRSVRWFDDMAFVVTFRQVDPLYAVDLRDPRHPRLLGHLEVPGFSEYLHPLGARRLLGIGQAASPRGFTWGAQAALFDVTDLTEPRRLDVVRYGQGSVAGAAADPRQLTWLPGSRTALTVVSKGSVGRTGWVSVLTFDGGPVENRMVEVEYGVEVDDVRLVPLPDPATGSGQAERVVLVTGDGVSAFPL